MAMVEIESKQEETLIDPVRPNNALREAAFSIEGRSGKIDLQSVIESLRSNFGVDHLVYHWVNAKGSEMGLGLTPNSGSNDPNLKDI